MQNKVVSEHNEKTQVRLRFSRKENDMETTVGNSFVAGLEKEASKIVTENGAIGYSTAERSLVDFNFKLPSFRGDPIALSVELKKIVAEKEPYVLKYLFYLRDCREGVGERETFRKAIVELLTEDLVLSDEDLLCVLSLIPAYGRWDDILAFVDTKLEGMALSLVKKQLELDLYKMDLGEPASLLAKWLPSDNASSKKSRYLAHKIARFLDLPVRSYRSNLVALRKYLGVVEQKACANEWEKIDYNAVPSKANLRYKNAFLRHDKARRRKYLEALSNGAAGVKINAAVNFPHEVVHAYYEVGQWFSRGLHPRGYDETLEQLWKNLPDMPGLDATLVVRDGSGSMLSAIPGTKETLALDVADALSVYCSSRCVGAFKDKFITFSSRPQLVSLAGKETLHDKLQELCNYRDLTNTDLEATFDLILRTAINGKLRQEELPKMVLIVSDMEFDAACGFSFGKCFSFEPLMETIANKFAAYGYKLPRLVFWNVNSRTNAIPMTENEAGLLLVSGFSANTLKMMASGETDCYKTLLEVLDSDRYSQVPLAKY